MKLWIMSLLLALTVPCVATIATKEVVRMVNVTVSSPAFSHGEARPARYTGDGADVSPPMTIGKTPPETRSLALIMDDPDAPAGMWVHWVVRNIPAHTREIPEDGLPLGA